jgi:hypothetical protein
LSIQDQKEASKLYPILFFIHILLHISSKEENIKPQKDKKKNKARDEE